MSNLLCRNGFDRQRSATHSQLMRGDTFAWGQLMAGALLAALPPVIVYAFLMDYDIAGLTAGATKG